MKRTIALTLLFAPTAPLAAQDIPLSKILVEKEGWREIASGFASVSFLDAKPNGEIVIHSGGPIGQVDLSGKAEKVDVPRTALNGKWQNLAISARNLKYMLDGAHILIGNGKKTARFHLPKGLTAANCITLWPDNGHAVIGESDGPYLWAIRIEEDGSFGPGDRYYSLRTRPGEKMTVTTMTMDTGYLLYACTPLGIQVFDPTGRLSGVIAAPSKDAMTAITIGGAKADELFVAAGDKIFARKIQGKASYTLKKSK